MTVAIDRADSARTAGWRDRVLLGYFLVSAVAVFGLWASYFSDGTAAAAVLEPSAETGTLLGRTFGALVAGLLLSSAAAGLRSSRHWARSFASLGVGMIGYAALNTLGETLASGLVESVLLVLALVVAMVVFRRPGDQPFIVVLSVLLAGCAVWLFGRAIQIGGGSLTEVVTVTAWPGPHYVAEATMALVTVWGLLARHRRRAWGSRLALVGMGMYCYSTLNALDWAHVNDSMVVPMLAVTLGAAIAGAVHLMKTEENHHAHRHRSIGPGRAPDGGGRHPVRRQGRRSGGGDRRHRCPAGDPRYGESRLRQSRRERHCMTGGPAQKLHGTGNPGSHRNLIRCPCAGHRPNRRTAHDRGMGSHERGRRECRQRRCGRVT